MEFNEILEYLKQGHIVRRLTWPDDQFLFMQIPAEIPMDMVPNMQSVPEKAKREFAKRFGKDIKCIYYHNQIAKVHDINMVTSWNPSITDLFAFDWDVII